MDKDSYVIHPTEFTPVNIYDSQCFEELISGKKEAVFADKGYANKKRKMSFGPQAFTVAFSAKGIVGVP